MRQKAIVLWALLLTDIYAGCKFPDPCEIKNKNFTALSTSTTVQKALKESSSDSSSLNYAWTKLFEQESIGAKRLADKTPDTIPEGDVLLADDGLLVGINKEMFENIHDLSITDIATHKIIYTSPLITNYSILPKSLFKYGNSYHLSCKIKTRNAILNIDNDFTILTTVNNIEIEKSLKKPEHDSYSEVEEKFLRAVNYFKEGYDYNGNAEILKIKGSK